MLDKCKNTPGKRDDILGLKKTRNVARKIEIKPKSVKKQSAPLLVGYALQPLSSVRQSSATPPKISGDQTTGVSPLPSSVVPGVTHEGFVHLEDLPIRSDEDRRPCGDRPVGLGTRGG